MGEQKKKKGKKKKIPKIAKILSISNWLNIVVRGVYKSSN